MNNQTKTIITGKDDHINTTEDLNNSKENKKGKKEPIQFQSERLFIGYFRS